MIFVLIALWSTSVALLLLNRDKISVRWLSAVTFCGGSGALAAVLGDSVLPAINQYEAFYEAAAIVQETASILSYYGLPYTFLMYALYYQEEFVSERWKIICGFILLTPIALMFIFTPVYTVEHPYLYRWLAAWAMPYVIAGIILCLLRKEVQPQLKWNHFFTCLAIVPPVLYSSVMNYLLPAFGMYEMWRYNTWMIMFAFAVFCFAIFTYGFMGIRLFIERQQLNYTLRAITSGTAILNHAIKNDVGKMKLFGEKIRRYAVSTNQSELLQDIEVIMNSASHIRAMISSVHTQTQDITLKLEPHPVHDLIVNQVAALKIYEPDISIQCRLPAKKKSIICDRSHIQEVLHNLCMNAIEAMPNGGQLTISAYENKRFFFIQVKDTGTGMEKKMIKKSLEPFFTTKTGSSLNFGLGLSYCYNVMKKHGGALQLESELGRGTTVTLKFPKRKRFYERRKTTTD